MDNISLAKQENRAHVFQALERLAREEVRGKPIPVHLDFGPVCLVGQIQGFDEQAFAFGIPTEYYAINGGPVAHIKPSYPISQIKFIKIWNDSLGNPKWATMVLESNFTR